MYLVTQNPDVVTSLA